MALQGDGLFWCMTQSTTPSGKINVAVNGAISRAVFSFFLSLNKVIFFKCGCHCPAFLNHLFFSHLLVCIKDSIIKSDLLPDRSIRHMLFDRFCGAMGSRDLLQPLRLPLNVDDFVQKLNKQTKKTPSNNNDPLFHPVQAKSLRQ